MPIQLPDLAEKNYADLMDEMLESIPRYCDRWTNFNPSDPGITILELLSWVSEMTLYRINRMPEESYVNFLRLAAGTSGAEVETVLKELESDPNSDKYRIRLLQFLVDIEKGNGKSVSDIKAEALQYLNSPYRAVTSNDFQRLSIEATEDAGDAKVRRAIVSEHPEEGKVEIIIVSDRRDRYGELIKKVADYLHPRRLVGTRIEVMEPEYTEVRIKAGIICQVHANPEAVRKNVEDRIRKHLDPLTGGAGGEGWVYGRTLTVFEIDYIIEETEGVQRAEYVNFENGKNFITVEGLVDLKGLTVEIVGGNMD